MSLMSLMSLMSHDPVRQLSGGAIDWWGNRDDRCKSRKSPGPIAATSFLH